MIYVQFNGKDKSKIVSWFGGKPKQDSEPFLGEIEASDPRYREYYDKFPEEVQVSMPTPES